MANNVVDIMLESVNINGHIKYVEEILTKYEWNQTEVKSFSDAIQLIKEKQNDNNLYMSVVGEFSSGKSSFINAQIRDNLLKADVLQATTSAATIIKYGEQLDASIKYKNGNSVTYSQRQGLGRKIWRRFFKPNNSKLKNEMREFINTVTTDEVIARDLDLVTITHFSKVSESGLIIIDTPGTNTLNERHALVTAKVIKESADAAIITIPSNVPLSNSLLSFVKEYLKDVISKCIFIVTKMDLIRIKEQQRVLDYIVQKLKNEFCTDKINLFPYSPLLMLKGIVPEVEFTLPNDDITFLTKQSEQTERHIIDILKQQRLIIQMQKLIILINDLFSSLEMNLKILEESYKDRHDALQKNKIKELDSFIKDQKYIHKNAINNGARTVTEKIFSIILKSQEELLINLHSDIYGAQNHKELNSIMENKLSLTISDKQDKLRQNLFMVFNEFQRLGQTQNSKFKGEFNKIYTNLSTLGGQIYVNEHALSFKTSDMVDNYAKIQVAAVNDTVKSDNKTITYAAVGGSGTGALIGTIIFPGVGTVVGALLGSLVGYLFQKPLDELKSSYYAKVKESIDESYCKIRDSSNGIANDIINHIIRDLFDIIDSHFSHYNILVKEIINRDENEKKSLEIKSDMINNDLNELKNRRVFLEGIRKNL
jgi:hypothetical protein